MDDLSIKVQIGGRTYPLTIDRNEEEIIRKAAKRVDETLARFQQNYAVRDKQDLLAMTALQMATHALKTGAKQEPAAYEAQLQELRQMLDDHLS